jgi:hypothetical protein
LLHHLNTAKENALSLLKGCERNVTCARLGFGRSQRVLSLRSSRTRVLIFNEQLADLFPKPRPLLVFCLKLALKAITQVVGQLQKLLALLLDLGAFPPKLCLNCLEP